MDKRRGRPPRMENTAPKVENRDRNEFVREESRTDRDIDKRERDNFYDLPDYDNFDYQNFDPRKLNLSAPPPRVDEKWGKMRQHWVAHKHNNGRRIQDLMAIGYRVRRPETVPVSFRGFTEQWESKDVIMVAGEHILMEIPEIHWKKMQIVKYEKNNNLIHDIKQSHGKVTRVGDGEVQELRDSSSSKFFRESEISKEPEGGSISFDE